MLKVWSITGVVKGGSVNMELPECFEPITGAENNREWLDRLFANIQHYHDVAVKEAYRLGYSNGYYHGYDKGLSAGGYKMKEEDKYQEGWNDGVDASITSLKQAMKDKV